ncbi:hypothetical protein N7532_009759 [Penicillium argentinense]|uniref:Phospholipase/carboxylesterase/thioesterase domain-containing protein n=1 Tax=Penicillium argentinense TaxID=1131581 RepID=A0A9W9JXA5_9EURO|nr:uncharacterized protein N7532_009759 [Penicillium argentinense]KAJ5084988.1 hypothetical protein N7532_009759 [Penicillium argentinense]
MDRPPLYIVPPQNTHTHTAILLHGRSGNGPNFASELFSGLTSNEENLPSSLPSWRWVFPSSRQLYDTSIQARRPTWFDAYSLKNIDEEQDLQIDGLRESVTYILEIIESEIALVNGDPQKIVLGGFSQGNATSLWTLFSSLGRFSKPLGGYLGLCGWLPFNTQITKVLDEANAANKEASLAVSEFILDKLEASHGEHEHQVKRVGDKSHLGIPALHIHHEDDMVIAPKLGREAYAILCGVGLNADIRIVGGLIPPGYDGHWIGEPFGFDEILQFLSGLILS